MGPFYKKGLISENVILKESYFQKRSLKGNLSKEYIINGTSLRLMLLLGLLLYDFLSIFCLF